MFKDYDKYLSASLKVYLFVLVIIFIMKLGGIDYFELNHNTIFTKAMWFLVKYKLDYVFQYLCLYLNFYLIKSIILKNYKFNFEIIIVPTIIIIGTCILYKYNIQNYYPIYNMIILFIYFVIKKAKLNRIIKVFVINILIQMLSSVIRNYDAQNYITVVNSIMNIDYYIMLIIWYKLEKQGGVQQCQEISQEVYSFSQMKANLLKSLTKLQKNLHNFKKLDKVSKLTFIIYFVLSLFWNTLSVIVVLFVARLNDTFIECIFILTSFWLSKRIFGKAFHLSSMSQCFIVSNLTYYFLNRITTPLGISIFVPIMLGVGLSYFTSKLVKKTYKPLYKGMPKELFEETILKVVDKDSDKYKICYDYFVNKQSALYLSGKYNYTEAGIRKIKDRVNNKIKELQ